MGRNKSSRWLEVLKVLEMFQIPDSENATHQEFVAFCSVLRGTGKRTITSPMMAVSTNGVTMLPSGPTEPPVSHLGP